jgi:glycosyltransferase involved in cell wall biosynthesis
MKIRILTQHFYPDSATVSSLLTQLATGLVSDGFEIEVFTSQPRDDLLFKLPKYEVYNSIKIFRLSSFLFNKTKKAGATLNYLYFFIKTFIRLLFISNKEKVIYLIVTNPPFLSFIGVFMCYIKGTKFVNLLYDVLPEPYINIKYISQKSLYVKLWQYLNKLSYKKSSKIVVNTDKIKKTIENKLFNIYKNSNHFNKISVISNWADEEYFRPIDIESNIFIKQNNLQNKFLINYAGTIGLLQEFSSLFELAKKLKNENIIFLIIGDGVKKKNLELEKEKYELNNVHFFPYQDKEMLTFAQAASHLSVVHLEKEVEGFCMPSKLCSILATGTPVLALCEQSSELAKIIEVAKCGFSATHKETDKIIDFIFKLKNNNQLEKNLRKNAREYFEKYYTKKAAIEKYKNLINELDI